MRFIVFAALALAGCAQGPAPQKLAIPDAPAPIVRPGAKVSLQLQPDNLFYAIGFVNGTPIRFQVDSGATVVVLTSDDASRIGNLQYQALPLCGYTVNGLLCGQKVTIDELNVGGILRKKISAVIMPSSRTKGSLLGMTYLRQLGSFTYNGKSASLNLSD